MMRWEQEQRQKLYNEIAGVIMSWSSQNVITAAEMHLLFNLLDEIAVNHGYPDLLLALRSWQEARLDDKINEIILATLIAADFKSSQEIENLIKIIEEFTA